MINKIISNKQKEITKNYLHERELEVIELTDVAKLGARIEASLLQIYGIEAKAM